MQVELARTEIQRLLRQSTFQAFVITLNGGEIAVIQHSENVAFDPTPGAATDFYARTGSLRLFSTFESIWSVSILSGAGTVPGRADPE